MSLRTLLFLNLLTLSLALNQCSHAKKENQPPTESDQQRIDKEYRENVDKLHELTSGTKATLDATPVPKATPSPKK